MLDASRDDVEVFFQVIPVKEPAFPYNQFTLGIWFLE